MLIIIITFSSIIDQNFMSEIVAPTGLRGEMSSPDNDAGRWMKWRRWRQLAAIDNNFPLKLMWRRRRGLPLQTLPPCNLIQTRSDHAPNHSTPPCEPLRQDQRNTGGTKKGYLLVNFSVGIF
jgi:hypothetical protein